jgi:hypothetical protein
VFISGLSLVLAIAAVGFLIYLIFQPKVGGIGQQNRAGAQGFNQQIDEYDENDMMM